MNRKIIAILMTLVLALSLAACGGGEETTLTGMVVSVDGTTISLVEMDTANMGNMNFEEGERPQRPEGMEDFNPEDFAGAFPGGEMPEGFTVPEGGMPEDFTIPEGGMPEDFTIPEGGMPEDFTMPVDGSMPNFGGGMPGFGGGFENFASDAETKNLEIGDAHISLEIEGGKATGTLDDIKAGAFVTVTMNGKGEVTNVLVSSMTSFAGGRRPGN